MIAAAPDVILTSWCGKRVVSDRIRQQAGWDTIPVARHGRIVEIKSPLIHQPEPTALTDGFDAIGAALADEGGTWPARLSRELGSPRGQSELS